MSNPLDNRKIKLTKTETAEFSIKTNGLSQKSQNNNIVFVEKSKK
jgi:hypothetical protein